MRTAKRNQIAAQRSWHAVCLGALPKPTCLLRYLGPLMRAHAQAVAGAQGDVLNVGFGMGLVDSAIQVCRFAVIGARPC